MNMAPALRTSPTSPIKKNKHAGWLVLFFVNFFCFVLRILAFMVNVLGVLGTVKAGGLPCQGDESVHLAFNKVFSRY